ncbi:MAG: hypothetical protein ACE5I1_00195 [bacterium]
MKARYLEVTFRKGKPLAAYYYLPRNVGEKSAKTITAGKGILIDYNTAGHPIGIEITAPEKINLRIVNDVLIDLRLAPIEQNEIAPLLTAA